MTHIFVFINYTENTRKGTLSSSSEIVILAIGQVLQFFLFQMKTVVPSQEIVRRITQSQTNTIGSRYSEFKDILLSMMNAYSYELKLLEITLKLHQTNLHEIQAKRFMSMKKAERHEMRIASFEFEDSSQRMNGGCINTRQLRLALTRSKGLLDNAAAQNSRPLARQVLLDQN